MFRIKICGVTSAEDALGAVEAGADAVGINFFSGSARFVPPSLAQPIVSALGNRAAAVAVFVNERPETIEAICDTLEIRVVQMSGREPVDSLAGIRYPVIKAVHLSAGDGLDSLEGYPCGAFLLDAAVPGEYGGTGRCLDWQALGRMIGGPYVRVGDAGSACRGRPWILAGGLTPENVAEAIRTARPFGVDVASGVEKTPGRKDPEKMKAFVDRAREGFGIAGIGG